MQCKFRNGNKNETAGVRTPKSNVNIFWSIRFWIFFSGSGCFSFVFYSVFKFVCHFFLANKKRYHEMQMKQIFWLTKCKSLKFITCILFWLCVHASAQRCSFCLPLSHFFSVVSMAAAALAIQHLCFFMEYILFLHVVYYIFIPLYWTTFSGACCCFKNFHKTQKKIFWNYFFYHPKITRSIKRWLQKEELEELKNVFFLCWKNRTLDTNDFLEWDWKC